MKATMIDRNELNYLMNKRTEALKRRTASAPRGAFHSYVTMSHHGDFIEAGYKVRNAKKALAEFLKPVVESLRTEGNNWSEVAKALEVSVTIVRECRDFYPELNDVVIAKREAKTERVSTPMGLATVVAKTDTEMRVVFDTDKTRSYWYDAAKVAVI